jgi:hypothetical protein
MLCFVYVLGSRRKNDRRTYVGWTTDIKDDFSNTMRAAALRRLEGENGISDRSSRQRSSKNAQSDIRRMTRGDNAGVSLILVLAWSAAYHEDVGRIFGEGHHF